MKKSPSAYAVVITVVLAQFFSSSSHAHCDAWDGPIVSEAQGALQNGEVEPLLKWVTAEQEPEIKEAFRKALAAAGGGEAARDVAELWFLETFVRLHRESEGAPYTGLKPAGQIDPALQLADKALSGGSADPLAEKIGNAVSQQIIERFEEARKRHANASQDPESGRAYVEAYVNYIHFVEGIHNMLKHEPHAH